MAPSLASIGNGVDSHGGADTSTNGYLAQPSGACCLKGTLHKGTPRGRFINVAGVETYITEPPHGKANGHVILYFPDVWGLFNNGLLVMDGFADAGYLTVGLDYFQGDPVTKYRKNRHDRSNPDFDYEAWKKKHMAFADEATPRWTQAIKAEFGKSETRYAAVGYCFGAPYVCNALAGSVVSAGAFAHPAFLKEHHFTNIMKPLFLSCSEIDHSFPKDSRRRAVDLLEESGKPYQLQVFSGVEHGFALRGNPENPYERYVKEQSLKSIVEWFDFWLAQ